MLVTAIERPPAGTGVNLIDSLLAIYGALRNGGLLFVLVDEKGILIEEVQGHVLVGFILLYRVDHLNQFQALHLFLV